MERDLICKTVFIPGILMMRVESKIKGLFDHGSCVAILKSEEVLYPLGLPETGELIFNKQSFYTRQEK